MRPNARDVAVRQSVLTSAHQRLSTIRRQSGVTSFDCSGRLRSPKNGYGQSMPGLPTNRLCRLRRPGRRPTRPPVRPPHRRCPRRRRSQGPAVTCAAPRSGTASVAEQSSGAASAAIPPSPPFPPSPPAPPSPPLPPLPLASFDVPLCRRFRRDHPERRHRPSPAPPTPP